MAASGAVPWTTLAASVCGAGHAREQTENQDALAVDCADDGNFAVAAVADGHGDISHLRSADGANFAVRALLDHVIGNRFRLLNIDSTQRTEVLRELFAGALDIWRQRVVADHRARPVQAAEFVARGLSGDAATVAAIEANTREPLPLYGTTLLAVAVWHSGGVAMRLGDGNVVVLPAVGVTPAHAVFADEIGDATQSMCDDDALQAAEYANLEVDSLSAVTISTDGYSKSFRRFDDFIANMVWVRDQLQSQAQDRQQKWLEDWLVEVSRDGSEDDVSFGILSRARLVSGQPDMPCPTERA